MIIQPLRSVQVTALLTLTDPMAHGDPDHVAIANVTPFRRRAQLLPLDVPHTPIGQQQLDAVLAQHPIPIDIAPFFVTLSAAQFLATALVRTFITLYRSEDGAGLFSGMERYTRLSARMEQSARRSDNLFQFWSDVSRAMQVGGSGERTPALLALLSLPLSLGSHMLKALADESETCVMLAREWEDTARAQTPDYAARAGKPVANPETRIAAFDAAHIPTPARTIVREIPAGPSGNTVRHSLVREPGMLHMLDVLGIGQEELPPHVGALLFNGGSIRKGAKAPTSEHTIGEQIIRAYPLLELVSGCADAFFLPESVLRVNPYLVCRENARALEPYGIAGEQPAESLIDIIGLNRHPQRWGESPMPFSFETLVTGAQVFCVFSLTPYASQLAHGALMAALATAPSQLRLGGKSGAGHGTFDVQAAFDTSASDAYTVHLEARKAALRAGLLDGTLGSGQQLLLI